MCGIFFSFFGRVQKRRDENFSRLVGGDLGGKTSGRKKSESSTSWNETRRRWTWTRRENVCFVVCNGSGSKSGQMRHCAKDKRWEKLTLQTCFCWELVINEGDAASARPTVEENTGFFFKRIRGKIDLCDAPRMY